MKSKITKSIASGWLQFVPIEMIWPFLASWLAKSIKNEGSKDAKRAFTIIRVVATFIVEVDARFPGQKLLPHD